MYSKVEQRTSANLNAAADINQLQQNINALIDGVGDAVPAHTIAQLGALYTAYYKNIKIKPNVTNPNYQVDVAWDNLRIEDVPLGAKSYTVDITAVGDMGLDTGSEAVSTWYYIWAFANADGSQVTCRLSAGTDNPVAPLWATDKRLIGRVRNGTDGHFVGFRQQDDLYIFATPQTAKSNGTDTSATEIDITALVPEDVSAILLRLWNEGANSGTAATARSTTIKILGYINGAYIEQMENTIQGYAAASVATPYIKLTRWIRTYNRKIQYLCATSAGSNSGQILMIGFKVPL